ncbi:MAG: hypothetical protein PWQ67_1731 [Clostridia bacterium]|jgi:hypothetical protein|nr:hypothetical protein [Clostridia bacterium]
MDVIYTTYPLDLVLENKGQEEEFNFQYISYNGIEMQVEPVGWNKFKIIRLYSTDLKHYLDSNLQPGSIISF